MHDKSTTTLVLIIIAAIVLGNLADRFGVFAMPDKANSALFAALAIWHGAVLWAGFRAGQVDPMQFGAPIRRERNPAAFWFVFLAFAAMSATLLFVMMRHFLG